MRFLSPVGGSGVGKEDQGADHCIAPLEMIHKVQLELGTIPQRVHPCGSLRPPWRPSGRLVPTRCDLEALVEAVQAGRWEALERCGGWTGLLCSDVRRSALE